MAGRIDARSRNQPFIDCLREAVNWAARVPDRGEAAQEHFLGLDRHDRARIGPVGIEEDIRRQDDRKMRVPVDHARHQCTTTAIDNLGAFSGLEVFVPDLLDQITLDQHTPVGGKLVGFAVKDITIDEECLRLWLFGMIFMLAQ